MSALIDPLRFLVEILLQPFFLFLLWKASREGQPLKRKRLRVLAWGGCAFTASIEIVLHISCISSWNLEDLLVQGVMLVGSLVMLRYEHRLRESPKGTTHLYVCLLYTSDAADE